MATRQYIGARYTLKIHTNSQNPLSAEWEANTSYEPLVLVNYNNSSYISRKDVPPTVGNPADNPTYWALSGFYNGQIANLQEEIDRIGAEYDDLVSDVSNLSTTVAGHTSSISSLNTTVAGHTSSISTLNTTVAGHTTSINSLNTNVGNVANLQTTAHVIVNAINELLGKVTKLDTVNNFIEAFSNKKIVIYGDSLSVANTTWTQTFINLMTALNSTVTLHATGGWKAEDALTAATADSTVYDVALVWIGINDSNEGTAFGSPETTGTFQYYYYQLLRRIRVVSPNCHTYCFGLSYATHHNIGLDKVKCLYFYDAAIAWVAKFSGCCFKTMLGLPCDNEQNHSALQDDGTHFLTAYSKSTLAYAIIDHLCSATAAPSPNINLRISQANCITNNLPDSVTISHFNCLIMDGSIYLSFLMNISANVPSGTDIIELNSSALMPAQSISSPTGSTYAVITTAGKLQIYGGPSAGRYAVTFAYLPKWMTGVPLLS